MIEVKHGRVVVTLVEEERYEWRVSSRGRLWDYGTRAAAEERVRKLLSQGRADVRVAHRPVVDWVDGWGSR